MAVPVTTVVCLINLFQIIHKGRDATPQPLTVTDLTDLEEQYEDDEHKKRSESLWDALVDEVVQNRFSSFVDASDPDAYSKVPDMDDITADVRCLKRFSSSVMLNIVFVNVFSQSIEPTQLIYSTLKRR